MKALRLGLLFFFSVLYFASCKKDHSVLGVDVQPDNDKLSAEIAQNFPVYAHTIGYDSIVSVGDRYKYLGCNDDPLMGKTEVDLYLNPSLPNSNIEFPPNATLSSAEIVLTRLVVDDGNAWYQGQLGASLSYSVYPLDSSLNVNRFYYSSNDRLHNKNQLIGTGTSSLSVYSGVEAIRIPVNTTFAANILQDKSSLATNAAFQSAYKGFYIKAAITTAEGVIFRYDIKDVVSGFYLYYFNSDTSKILNTFRFGFDGSGCTAYNTVKFSPSNIVQQQINGDTALGAQQLYLKGLGATRLKVQIPFLKNYGDTFDVSVNRAEVIFNIDQSIAGSSGTYNYPQLLSLVALDSTGKEILVQDQRNSSYITRYDGRWDQANMRYAFNIPMHAQAILKGARKNYGFHLVMADPTLAGRRDNYIERVVLAGSSQAIHPVFNISFTRLKHD
jgi:hypothetical protein